MLHRPLGYSGLFSSAFALGAWRTFGATVDTATTERIMAEAFDAGVTFFDGAEVYGYLHNDDPGCVPGQAEIVMGQALRNLRWRREDYILTGKVSPGGLANKAKRDIYRGLNRKRITDCVDATLKRYGTDYLDIFFCHRPFPGTAPEDLVISMNALIQQGKILYWGTSEFSAAELLRLSEIARDYRMSPPLVEQCGHNMLGRQRMERDLVPVWANTRMSATTFCPLRMGVLTGKYLDGVPAGSRFATTHDIQLDQAEVETVRRLKPVADELGISLTHLALAWILKNPNVGTVILGASRPGMIAANVQACAAVPLLTDAVMQRIEGILGNHPLREGA